MGTDASAGKTNAVNQVTRAHSDAVNAAESPVNSEAEQVRSRGGHPHVLDHELVDLPSALTALAEIFSFPPWFGHNLDALYDCLIDLSWLPPGDHVLIWSGSEAFKDADPRAYVAIRHVLSDAQRTLAPPASPHPPTRTLTIHLIPTP